MSDILILGGGFAGVWSAMAAARLRHELGGDLTIALVAPGEDLTIRPRLYQANPGTMRVPLDRVLRPVGVRRIAGQAITVDTSGRTVTVVDGTGSTHVVDYRRLVLATGSALVRPTMPGAEHLHDVDTLGGAVALDAHLHRLPAGPACAGQFTAVVAGAGFTGIEVSIELMDRLQAIAGPLSHKVRVILLERADTVGPELGSGPRSAIRTALNQVGVEARLNTSLSAVTPTGATLRDGTVIAAHTVIWTAGMAASPLTRQIVGRRDPLGRLLVDPQLRVPESPDVFASGDTAAADTGDGHLTLQSCQHAIPLGRIAGHNAAADLLGHPAVPFSPEPYVTCLDLGSAGAVFTTGFDREVRMTGAAAKGLKRSINERRIYPPLDDAKAILNAGDPKRTWAEMA
ncbi:FAD-dependent oxidoreductase [Dactylosporangium sp. NPDC050688]|uniref:NAD(P)/FAD-dependent oxidoreductase n=1 Tax=Dactylosporangium sp. NPDC050688 TaxID=3157217 RepID=UPI0033C208C1